jgi:hypothetical protein
MAAEQRVKHCAQNRPCCAERPGKSRRSDQQIRQTQIALARGNAPTPSAQNADRTRMDRQGLDHADLAHDRRKPAKRYRSTRGKAEQAGFDDRHFGRQRRQLRQHRRMFAVAPCLPPLVALRLAHGSAFKRAVRLALA